jgi:Glyoxalase-like domain
VLAVADDEDAVPEGVDSRDRQPAARGGLDATAIWEWGVAERIATGLSLTEIELQPFGRQMLATADHVASE